MPLLPKLIFPLALSAGERPKLAGALAKRANITLLSIPTSKHTQTQTGKQTHACANTIQKVRGRALIDTHRSCLLRIFLRFKLHSLICSAAYSCRFCMCLPHCCLCQPVCLVGESVRGCFCSHDMSVCFGESLCLVCTLSGADTLSDIMYSFLTHQQSRAASMSKQKCNKLI